MPWKPPARSAWTEKLVAVGEGLGDGGRSIVSLEPDRLRQSARMTTGLDDFGDTWWEEPFARLCRSLNDEAELHLPGRLRTRGEIQQILQNRLRLVALWQSEPSIATETVSDPIVVTGLGRSGTTLLHELLACDPDNRPPLLWEFLHTVPAGGDRSRPAVGRPGDRPQLCDDEITLMDEMVPSFTAMHENGGNLPTECIFAFAHQFSSDMYTGLYNVAGYTMWRSTQDQSPIYEWHRSMLQTMQWASPTTRWVLKAPSHLSALPLLFTTYPDAKVVITHRDPLRVVGSLADLMATLHYMHSNRVDHDILVEFMCMGLEHVMDEVTAERDRGALPEDQISDVLYHDLVDDPMAVIEALYRKWDLPVTAVFRTNLEAYLGARHTNRSPQHDYSFSDTGLDLAAHRALVAPYQERFGVRSEV
ncbi:MAG: sulfotransferase family protein [Acidimicrobiales bacterium]